MADPDRGAGSAEGNGVLRVEEQVEPEPARGGGHRELVPCEHPARGQRVLFRAGSARVGAQERRAPIQEDELVRGPEREHRVEEPMGVDSDPAAVLIVMSQHHSDAHVPLREEAMRGRAPVAWRARQGGPRRRRNARPETGGKLYPHKRVQCLTAVVVGPGTCMSTQVHILDSYSAAGAAH